MFSRRGFLIGAGNVLTTAFFKDARAFIRKTGLPLLARPAQVAQTLYWYGCEEGYGDGESYLLTLSEYIIF